MATGLFLNKKNAERDIQAKIKGENMDNQCGVVHLAKEKGQKTVKFSFNNLNNKKICLRN